jgi:hypothetical protein
MSCCLHVLASHELLEQIDSGQGEHCKLQTFTLAAAALYTLLHVCMCFIEREPHKARLAPSGKEHATKWHAETNVACWYHCFTTQERPDAILPTMGGQTGLNLAKNMAESGMLDKYGVELIGAKLPSIDRAEDRELFKQAMKRIGLKTPPR